MFSSQILEIAAGIVFVFLIASLLASAARELVEAVLKTRSVHLERGIRQLLDDPDGTRTTKALFDHPQLYGLFDGVYDPAKLTSVRIGSKTAFARNGVIIQTGAKRLPLMSKFPSYIPSRNFAVALLDLLGAGGGDERADNSRLMETLRANAMALQPGKVRDALLVALAEGGNDFDRARTSLEAWFDAGMDRVSGWYKRESQIILLIIGLITAIGFNIDALSVARTLANNNTVRQQILVQATSVQQTLNDRAASNKTTPADLQITPEELRNARAGLGDLIGWRNISFAPRDAAAWITWLHMMLGWMITALAISLGAPFWFDVLNKIMVIRSTVKPYEKSPPEGSEDRGGGTPSAERLEPSNRAVAPVAAGGGAPAPVIRKDGPILGHVRLAVDQTGLQQLALKVDSEACDLPEDGFVELPLEMGVLHRLEVTATNAAQQPVRWSGAVRLTFDNDLLPMVARLA